jgi:hypothetical protein
MFRPRQLRCGPIAAASSWRMPPWQLARRLIAVRRCAVFVVAVGRKEDAADKDALGQASRVQHRGPRPAPLVYELQHDQPFRRLAGLASEQ